MKDAENEAEFFCELLALKNRIKKPYSLEFKLSLSGKLTLFAANAKSSRESAVVFLCYCLPLIQVLQECNISSIAQKLERAGLLEPEQLNLL
jgi:hypothetical protein